MKPHTPIIIGVAVIAISLVSAIAATVAETDASKKEYTITPSVKEFNMPGTNQAWQ